MTNPLADVARYYSLKLAEHGPTPRGVDWNDEDSQKLRFAELAKLIDLPAGFSVNDLGCGYGALFSYLSTHFDNLTYHGVDVAPDMIEAGKSRFSACRNAHFASGEIPLERSDFGFASGIFNVKLKCGDVDWRRYMEVTLDALDRTSARGFAFNCLTSYSDPERMRADLYYANPGALFDLCKVRYSRQVALLHDYGLYEFTILVRKT
jgi:SAM-dependent methyltransferase